jgi:nicotinamide-nucleotide amidase
MAEETPEQAAERLIRHCKASGLVVVTAESLTGGRIAMALMAAPGASDHFHGAFITYRTEAKRNMLGVPAALLEREGAVSEATARCMARNALERTTADFAIAATGVAGPDPQEGKPVGRVHLAVAARSGDIQHRQMDYGDRGREQIIDATARDGLDFLCAHMNARTFAG